MSTEKRAILQLSQLRKEKQVNIEKSKKELLQIQEFIKEYRDDQEFTKILDNRKQEIKLNIKFEKTLSKSILSMIQKLEKSIIQRN
jgi:uncharacterized protein YktA (UPF0223 family)